MPLSAATWSMMENLISHVSTARGCSAAVSVIWLPYGLDAACRFETCWSSDELVIRWLPTIAADPACTGEHAAISAQAPRPAAPSASPRLVFLAAQPGQTQPCQTQAVPSNTSITAEIYDSDSTERTTSAHQASSSVSRSGSPPKPPLDAPAFGTGTSMVRTVGLRIVFGYSR